jgi:hypothetical protein
MEKVPEVSGAFFVLYGRFLRVFWEIGWFGVAFFVVNLWWSAWQEVVGKRRFAGSKKQDTIFSFIFR